MKTSSEQRIAQYMKNGWWTDHTLHGELQHWAQKTPERLAIADQPNRMALCGSEPQRLNYRQLDEASVNLATQLLNNGVGVDDVVIVQLPNITELIVAYYAISRIGAIISPVPIQYGNHELRHIVAQLHPAAFITLQTFRNEPLAEQRKAMLEDCPSTKLMVFGTQLSDQVNCLTLIANASEDEALTLEKHRKAYQDNANNILTICWTSGTTGTPKGVPRSHAMWFATARSSAAAARYTDGERLLNPFPAVNMAALGGFLFPAALHGCSLFLHHPLDVPLFLKQIEQEEISFTIVPPPLLNQLAKSPDMWAQFDFSKLRAVGSGSAPLSPSMIDVFDNHYGKPVINFYGSNEGISLYSTPAITNDPDVRAALFPRVGSGVGDWKGLAADTLLTRVMDIDTGLEINEVGKTGELVIDGATVFDGYLNSPNDNVFDQDGYFRTGDLVEICGEPAHYYRISGRCKDIINRGGMKISPSDIDVLLEGFAHCVEAAVCSYADERLGEKICACLVVADDGSKPTLEEVCRFLADQGLAKFKLPERIAFFDSLPRNPLGKVQRFILQEQISERLV